MSETETEVPPITCSLCGKVVKNQTGLAAHTRFKHEERPMPAPEPKPEEPKPEEPKPAAPAKLKPYPFHDGAVNENAALRMVRMAKPACPITTNMDDPGIKNGTKKYTGDANCQERFKKNNQGVWDVERCESLGHDPFFTTFKRVEVTNLVGADGTITGQKQTEINERRLNVVQVSDNPRHNTGMSIQLELARGSRFLEDLGYISPCEFRNCVKEKRIKTKFGEFCSERHARLVAADRNEIFLPVGGDPYTEDKTMREREQILGAQAIY